MISSADFTRVSNQIVFPDVVLSVFNSHRTERDVMEPLQSVFICNFHLYEKPRWWSQVMFCPVEKLVMIVLLNSVQFCVQLETCFIYFLLCFILCYSFDDDDDDDEACIRSKLKISQKSPKSQ